ncbi:hypothetical protein PI125_g13684 [Phytophthora idaei]|nr:hypothetical protein PI125_g13684 [Phytophthora idaei]
MERHLKRPWRVHYCRDTPPYVGYTDEGASGSGVGRVGAPVAGTPTELRNAVKVAVLLGRGYEQTGGCFLAFL